MSRYRGFDGKRRVAGLACLLLFSVWSCSSMLDSNEAVRTAYWLNPFMADSAQTTVAGPDVKLQVQVAPGLDTDRILTLGKDASINYLATAKWPEYLPEYITSLFDQSLRSGGAVTASDTATGAGSTRCALTVLVQKFHVQLNGSGRPDSVIMQLVGEYSCDGALIPLRIIRQTNVSVPDTAGVVAAFQTTVSEVSRQLLQSTVLSGAEQ